MDRNLFVKNYNLGDMMFEFSKSLELQEKLKVFMDKNVYPNESNITEEINSGNIWEPSSIIEELKVKQRRRALELILAESDKGAGLSNLDYAPLCEIMGDLHMRQKYLIVMLLIQGIWRFLKDTRAKN